MLSPAEIEVTKSQAHALVDRVPPEQLDAAIQLLTNLISPPVDDEPITADDRRRIAEGRAALARGEQGLPMEELLAEFGLTIDDFPAQS